MPTSPKEGYLPWRISGTASKVDEIANRCFYMIAMGKWLPGTRLPPVRQLESEWSANRVTVLKAYGMLMGRGLVRHEPRGSFYVADQGPGRDFARDRIVLENLYEDVVRKIAEETDLSPPGVLKMLCSMAELRTRENPEVAFVECSRSQAADHAGEISARLGFPVLPLSLDEVRGRKVSVPSHVRVVLTTVFHIDELAGLRKDGTEVVALPVNVSPELLADLGRSGKEVVFLETDEDLARRTEKDAVYMMGMENPDVVTVTDIGAFLHEALDGPGAGRPEALFLVPQKAWEGLDARWREHDRVRAISCKLSKPAWQMIADALRVPFGVTV